MKGCWREPRRAYGSYEGLLEALWAVAGAVMKGCWRPEFKLARQL